MLKKFTKTKVLYSLCNRRFPKITNYGYIIIKLIILHNMNIVFQP